MQVHDLALWLLLALPVIGAAGVSLKVWLASRVPLWFGRQAGADYQAAPSMEVAK